VTVVAALGDSLTVSNIWFYLIIYKTFS